MFCPNCGTQVDDGISKCNNCGYEFRKADSIANTLNRKNRTAATSTIRSANDKIQIKKSMIVLSGLTIILMLFSWVKFVGKFDVSYNLFTLPRFAVDEESFLYWILYDIWDHNGAKHFASFANTLRIFAIIMVIFHGLNIISLLKDHPLQKLVTRVAGLWSLVTSLYFIGWMFWFKAALMKYHDYTIRDGFHITLVTYIVVTITFTLIIKSFQKVKPKYDIENND